METIRMLFEFFQAGFYERAAEFEMTRMYSLQEKEFES